MRGAGNCSLCSLCSWLCFAPNADFPKSKLPRTFRSWSPVGTIEKATRSRWINESAFLDFLDHVGDLTCSSRENKILVLLDNHETHISLSVIDKACEKGIVLLTIPPKTSHKLQPLDKTVFGSFKSSYNRAMDNWLRCNPGKKVTIYEIPALINEPQQTSLVPRNILSGFSYTGNWPYNPELFTSADFAPSFVTDQDLISETVLNSSGTTQQLLQNEFTAE